jgi:hypothetical protein
MPKRQADREPDKSYLSGGFVVPETDNSKALAAFAYRWNDLMLLSASPVTEDADLAEVFAQG